MSVEGGAVVVFSLSSAGLPAGIGILELAISARSGFISLSDERLEHSSPAFVRGFRELLRGLPRAACRSSFRRD